MIDYPYPMCCIGGGVHVPLRACSYQSLRIYHADSDYLPITLDRSAFVLLFLIYEVQTTPSIDIDQV